MPGSTKSFLFPDINVWVALTYEGHVHHLVAHDWLADAGVAQLTLVTFDRAMRGKVKPTIVLGD